MRISDWSSDVCSSDLHVPMTHGFDGDPELSINTAKAAAMMGLTAEMLSQTHQVSRQQQDEFALASHQRAYAAWKNGEFKNEMVPVEGHDADGAPLLVDFDEVVRPDANLADLGHLKPARSEERRVGKEWLRTSNSRGAP